MTHFRMPLPLPLPLRAPLALCVLALAGCLPESVESVTLAPETEEVAEALRAADARWEAAGVAPNRIVVLDVGSPAEGRVAPVRYVPGRGPASETRTTYRGLAFVGVRWIELASLQIDLVTHEMGHAMGAYDAENNADVGACALTPDMLHRPIMCEHVGNTITADDDLSQVCAEGPCVRFNPEDGS